MFIATLLTIFATANGQALESVNAERPSICVSAQGGDGGLVSADSRDLRDSVKDLARTLGLLKRKHAFDLSPAGGPCNVRLLVLRRIEDEERETCTVTVRLLATTRAGRLHDEELQAMEGTWRGAATTISRKVGFFVDRNRASLGGPLPSTPDAGSAKNSTSEVGPTAAPATERATPATIAAASSATTQAQAATRVSVSARTLEDVFLDWVRLRDEGGRSLETPIYVRLFTTNAANLGTGGEGGKDTRAAEAGMLQSQGPALLRESFLARAGAAGLKAQAYDGEGFDQLPAAALIIEGEFVTIDPGSRAKRYWVGFGAGKSAIETAGRIMTPSGDIVAEFRHRRIGAMGMGGGDSAGKLLSDTRSTGEDLAKFVDAWLTHKLPKR